MQGIICPLPKTTVFERSLPGEEENSFTAKLLRALDKLE
jgi:hypothetical protein